MNTIADKLRARAQEIRARYHGYEGFGNTDADFLEEIAYDLEQDEQTLIEKYEEVIGELKDEIRDIKMKLEGETCGRSGMGCKCARLVLR